MPKVVGTKAAEILPDDADYKLLVDWLRGDMATGKFARMLGVSRETVWYWTNGTRPPSPMARRALKRQIESTLRSLSRSGETPEPKVAAELRRIGFKV